LSFITELKRRNVFKVGVAYAIVAWLLIQITDIMAPALNLPGWTLTFIIYLVIIGFPLALFLAWAFELTPEGIKPTKTVEPAKSITQVTGQKLNYSIIALLSLAVVFLVVDNYVLTEDRSLDTEVRSETESHGEQQVIPTAVPERKKEVLSNSIAVLPFENLSPDPDNAYFAAGIHDTILNELARIGDLNVISRTAMLRYVNSTKTLAEIAEELNVETVMEGSVQYAEGRVLVTAQLIDPNTNAHLWSQNYDRAFAGIFALQAEIAANIAKALEARLLPAERAAIEKPMTGSPEAYSLYLRAVASVVDLGPFGFGISTDLHRYLDQAIAIDPDFARAYALKAVDYVSAIIRPAKLSDRLSRDDLEKLAIENAQRALDIDPDMGLAYDVLAQVHWFNWRAVPAEENFKKALALSPNDRDVLIDYAVFLLESGRAVEAIPVAEPLADTHPGIGHFILGEALLYAGDVDQAIPLMNKGNILVPVLPLSKLTLCSVEAGRGNEASALRHLRAAEGLWQDETAEPVYLAWAAYCYSRIGHADDVRRLFNRLEAMAGEYTVGAAAWAIAFLALGERESALMWLKRAAAQNGYDDSYAIVSELALNRIFQNPVLEQPEFVEIRKRLGPK
jgi:TolB-like protein/Flp pilus assembly protein TadD